MKIKKTLLLTTLIFTGLAHAQGFKGNASGSVGLLNSKVRIQYEIPLESRGSYGMNLNYYLIKWTGPVFEPFLRFYSKKDGNSKGSFWQAKVIYGNLSNLYYDNNGSSYTKPRWPTYGFGINYGNKFLLGKHFTVEYLSGIRFLSSPVYGDLEDIADWYLSTGFPIDFQMKFGYQF